VCNGNEILVLHEIFVIINFISEKHSAVMCMVQWLRDMTNTACCVSLNVGLMLYYRVDNGLLCNRGVCCVTDSKATRCDGFAVEPKGQQYAYINSLSSFSRSYRQQMGAWIAYSVHGLDDRGVRVRVPVGSTIFFSPRRPDRLWGPPNLLSNGYRWLFPRG
jgi:hypothetical protein